MRMKILTMNFLIIRCFKLFFITTVIYLILASVGKIYSGKMEINAGTTKRQYTKFGPSDLPTIDINETVCLNILAGNEDEISRSKILMERQKRKVKKSYLYHPLLSKCRYVKKRHYIRAPLNEEEAGFPIAFSIMVYKDFEQVERLIRIIYRPQNYYCLHVDKKSHPAFTKTIQYFADCFDNIFLIPEQFHVIWGTITVLDPVLQCMKYLLKFKSWKYFINLTGQEFPLKTNWELVQILKAFKGSNDIEGRYLTETWVAYFIKF